MGTVIHCLHPWYPAPPPGVPAGLVDAGILALPVPAAISPSAAPLPDSRAGASVPAPRHVSHSAGAFRQVPRTLQAHHWRFRQATVFFHHRAQPAVCGTQALRSSIGWLRCRARSPDPPPSRAADGWQLAGNAAGQWRADRAVHARALRPRQASVGIGTTRDARAALVCSPVEASRSGCLRKRPIASCLTTASSSSASAPARYSPSRINNSDFL